MDGGKYLSKIDNLLKKNRLLWVVIGLMIIWNSANSIHLYMIQSDAKVVIIPVGLEAMQIGNGRATENYLRRMARYITTMIGTYTAATARTQFMELLSLFDPSKSVAAQIKFEKISSEIERFPSISSHIRWVGDTPLGYTNDFLQVKVKKDRLVNGMITKSENKIYCIDYKIEGTRFNLLNVRERNYNGESNEDICSIKKN